MTNFDKLDLIRNGKALSLAYCSLTCYPGNIYEPRHRRLVYREEGTVEYTAIAFDADWQEILRVEAEDQFAAEDALAAALNAYFRAGCVYGLTPSESVRHWQAVERMERQSATPTQN